MGPLLVSDSEHDAIEAVRQAYQLTKDHIPAELEFDRFHLSHKVIKLIELLNEQFDPQLDKCVVFAQERLTVALLADLFQQPGLKRQGYKAGRLVSVNHLSNYEMLTRDRWAPPVLAPVTLA